MPSEHRLHPTSILFALAGSLKALALPALVLMLSSLRPSPAPGAGGQAGGRWGPGRWVNSWTPGDYELENWQIWLLVFLIPATIAAIVRFLTFRVQYEGGELVIRSGLLFRNERHVPYGRIQNLDATRTVMHRLLGVAEVRIETGGGKEPEARISVLHMPVFEDMRRRVLEGRARAGLAAAPASELPEAVPAAAVEPQTLLHLPLRELLLLGLLENRGVLIIGAIYGGLWETGLQGLVWERVTSGLYAPGLLRDAGRRLGEGQLPPLWQIGVMAGGLLGLILLTRLLSMAWFAVKLHGFRLTRVGGDLRNEYGLLTRMTTTIPLGRVQTLTLRETPLQRLAGRMSVRVETAGGPAGSDGPGHGPKRPRERLAPIIRTSAVPALVHEVMPHADLETLDWQPVHPRAFRRAVKPMLLLTTLPSVSVLALLGWRLWPALVVTIAVTALVTRRQVQRLAWAANDDVVAVRTGWLWRSVTITPVAKIQTVMSIESPFDRRTSMAGVRVDTAGGRELSIGMSIPYLARETAQTLLARLSAQAAQTAFRW
jgi:putative membrane protein